MKKIIWKITQAYKITKIKAIGDEIDKLLLEICDEYFYQTAQGKSHQEAIELIIVRQFENNNQEQRAALAKVFTEKNATDKSYMIKYGSKGDILSHLHKLTAAMYFAENKSDSDHENLIENKIKKNIGDISLYMFERYHN